MDKFIPEEEIIELNYGEMVEWIESNNIFHSSLIDMIKRQVEKPTLESAFPDDSPEFHGIPLPDNSQSSFNVGYDFGVLWTAILSMIGKRIDKMSKKQIFTLKHFVFLGVLSKYENERLVGIEFRI